MLGLFAFPAIPGCLEGPAQKVQSVVEFGVTPDLEGKPTHFVLVEGGNARVICQQRLCRSVGAIQPEPALPLKMLRGRGSSPNIVLPR